jgi:hypothetical protein
MSSHDLNLKHTIYEYFYDCYLVKNIKLPDQCAVKKNSSVLERVPTVKKCRRQKKRFASGGETPSSYMPSHAAVETVATPATTCARAQTHHSTCSDLQELPADCTSLDFCMIS